MPIDAAHTAPDAAAALKLDKTFARELTTQRGEKLKVYLVPGKKLRDTVYDDFIGGGHHYVSPEYAAFIPEDEIWIEQENSNDAAALLFHELIERDLMKYSGYSYEDGHAEATKYETIMRKAQIKEAAHKLLDQLSIAPLKSRQTS